MNSESFKPQFDWQNRLLSQVSDIIRYNARYMVNIKVASDFQDSNQATDMILEMAGNKSIAVRIRKRDCIYRDLTIRARAFGGGKTEIHKLRAGFGDWYIYAWENAQAKLAEWILVDIHKLRQSGLLDANRRVIPNPDGTGFISISISELYEAGTLVSGYVKRDGKFWHKFISDDYAQTIWSPVA